MTRAHGLRHRLLVALFIGLLTLSAGCEEGLGGEGEGGGEEQEQNEGGDGQEADGDEEGGD